MVTGRLGRLCWGVALLGALGVLLTGGVASAAAASNVTVNCSHGGDLQAAIDANNNTTITVRGVCSGHFLIRGKTLTVRGEPSAVLDGQGTGPLSPSCGSTTIHQRH